MLMLRRGANFYHPTLYTLVKNGLGLLSSQYSLLCRRPQPTFAKVGVSSQQDLAKRDVHALITIPEYKVSYIAFCPLTSCYRGQSPWGAGECSPQTCRKRSLPIYLRSACRLPIFMSLMVPVAIATMALPAFQTYIRMVGRYASRTCHLSIS